MVAQIKRDRWIFLQKTKEKNLIKNNFNNNNDQN